MENYYKYLPLSVRDQAWGLSVLNAGCTRILPNQPYPFSSHPSHHNFTWTNGRVLQEYQLIYITKGEGLFESAAAGSLAVTAGTVLLLFPGEKHRYKPRPETGWDEYWVGFRGSMVDQLSAQGFLRPEKAWLAVGFDEYLLGIFLEIIEQSKKEKAGYQPLMAGAVMHLLGRLQAVQQQQYFAGKDVEVIVNKAKLLFKANLHQPVGVEEVARELGVGYSRFRKLFKTYTGIAPNQYHIQLKIQRAKELLLIPEKSVKEIAYELQFESNFFFSKQFKDKTGLTPAEYRRKALGMS